MTESSRGRRIAWPTGRYAPVVFLRPADKHRHLLCGLVDGDEDTGALSIRCGFGLSLGLPDGQSRLFRSNACSPSRSLPSLKIETGHSYPLLAKNASNATHYRIRIDGASPPERWVSVDCGSYRVEGTNDGGLHNFPSGNRPAGGHRAEVILSLGWEPSFCEGHSNKSECASATPSGVDATHFTLHGLWPQPRRNQYCNVSQALINADEKATGRRSPRLV